MKCWLISHSSTTAQNSSLWCTEQQHKEEHGENHLHHGLCFSTCCAFGTTSDGNSYTSVSDSMNANVPRKSRSSSLSSHRVRVRLEHHTPHPSTASQYRSSRGRGAEPLRRALGFERKRVAMVSTACLYSKGRSYHQSNTLPLCSCF